MKPLRIIFTSMLLLGVSVFCADAGDLIIDLRVDKQTAANIHLKIEGDIATASVDGETERFNLKQMSWLDARTDKWTTLAQCKEWAEQSKARTLKSADSAPAHIRPFLVWSLEPSFKVTKSNDTLRLTSGQVDYFINGTASKANTDAYFRYAVLNAYKKAMVEKKLPPYSELKAIEEMKTLGRIPGSISVTMPGIPRSPAIEMNITESK